jgi:hypothetical protein
MFVHLISGFELLKFSAFVLIIQEQIGPTLGKAYLYGYFPALFER